ncbi:MAG: hypothetical protein R8J94_06840 [Acidimicrobiia bacterium]|nr:hypothetical protein [Acidimicrobiia bacterium]
MKQEPAPPAERPPMPTLSDAAVEILRAQPETHSFYVSPNVSKKRERNARAATAMPAWEEVVALVDCTVFGSAKDALVFGREGLYYKWSSHPDIPTYQSWDAVAKHGAEDIEEGGLNTRCRIGERVYSMLGDRAAICAAINEMWGLLVADPKAGDLASLGELSSCYVAPDVPKKKERNARASCAVPDDEEVLALVDFTVFGSANNAVVLTSSGIYHDHLASDVPVHVPKRDIWSHPITVLESDWASGVVSIGGVELLMAMPGDDLDRLVEVLGQFFTPQDEVGRADSTPTDAVQTPRSGVKRATTVDELVESVGRFICGIESAQMMSALENELRTHVLSGVALETSEVPVAYVPIWGEELGLVLTDRAIHFDATEWPDAKRVQPWAGLRAGSFDKLDYYDGRLGQHQQRFRVLVVGETEYPVVWGTYWRDIVVVLDFFCQRVPVRPSG